MEVKRSWSNLIPSMGNHLGPSEHIRIGHQNTRTPKHHQNTRIQPEHHQNTRTGVLSGGGVLVFRTPLKHHWNTKTPLEHQNTTRTPPCTRTLEHHQNTKTPPEHQNFTRTPPERHQNIRTPPKHLNNTRTGVLSADRTPVLVF